MKYKIAGPCALSRCAVEWGLGISAIGQAIWFMAFPEGEQLRSYLMHHSEAIQAAYPLSWSLPLILVGIFQLLTVSCSMDRKYARAAATVAGVVWIWVGWCVSVAGLLLLTWPILLMVIGCGYVASQLKP